MKLFFHSLYIFYAPFDDAFNKLESIKLSSTIYILPHQLKAMIVLSLNHSESCLTTANHGNGDLVDLHKLYNSF